MLDISNKMGCAFSTFWGKKPAQEANPHPRLYIPLPRREPVPEFPVLPTFHENPSGTFMHLYEEDNWRPYYEGRSVPPIGYSGVGRAPSLKGKRGAKGKGKEREDGESATSGNEREQDRGHAGGSGGADKKTKGALKNMDVIGMFQPFFYPLSRFCYTFA